MFAKFVKIITVASMLTMLNYRLNENVALKYSIYGLLVYFVVWIIRYTYNIKPGIYNDKKVIILFLFLSLNLLFSPYDPLYPRLIKYLGYLGSFVFGYILCENNIKLKCNKWYLIALVFVPIVCVGLLDHTTHKTLFFQLSNSFSFYGLCASLFVFTIYNNVDNIFKWVILLIIAYIGSASTLGIVVAMALAIVIINRKNIKLMFMTVLLGITTLLCVMYVDLQIFLRIRDVVNLAISLSWDDWANLKDMDLYQVGLGVNMESDRSDNTSFLWRIAHWQKILDGYFENWWYAIPFGLGDGYSLIKCGYNCHNEFLKFFAENGIVVFIIIIGWLKKADFILRDNKVYYFILAIICYHLTENLIDTFVACVMFYFCLGYWIKKASTEVY